MASKNKIIEMIASIKTIYPYYAKDTDVEMLVNTWTLLLKDYPDNAVEAAFYKCLQVCKMPPTPADVIEKMDAMLNAAQPTDEQLWSEFVAVLKKVEAEVYYLKYPKFGVDHRANIRDYWDKLDDKIKQYLGSVGELMRISSNYTDDELKFEKNRFLKAMTTLQTRADHLALAQRHNLLIEG